LGLRDIKDDIKGPHLDSFGGGPTAFHTALVSLLDFYKKYIECKECPT